MFRAGGTIQADDVNRQFLENGDGGVGIRAEEHPPGGVERDLGLDRQPVPGFGEGQGHAVDGGFDFEDVLRGFDQDQIHAALNQADGLIAENVGQFVELQVREFGVIGRGQLAAWADGTGDEARLAGLGGEFIRQAARQAGGGLVDFMGPFCQAIFAERQAVGAEGVRFEHIHADFQKRAVDFFNGGGIGNDEEIVAAIIFFAAKMLGGQMLVLQAGAHRAIENENFLFERVEVAAVGVGTVGHSSPWNLSINTWVTLGLWNDSRPKQFSKRYPLLQNQIACHLLRMGQESRLLLSRYLHCNNKYLQKQEQSLQLQVVDKKPAVQSVPGN